MKFLFVSLLSCFFLFTSAASAQELGEVAFQQAIKDLGNDFREYLRSLKL